MWVPHAKYPSFQLSTYSSDRTPSDINLQKYLANYNVRLITCRTLCGGNAVCKIGDIHHPLADSGFKGLVQLCPNIFCGVRKGCSVFDLRIDEFRTSRFSDVRYSHSLQFREQQQLCLRETSRNYRL